MDEVKSALGLVAATQHLIPGEDSLNLAKGFLILLIHWLSISLSQGWPCYLATVQLKMGMFIQWFLMAKGASLKMVRCLKLEGIHHAACSLLEFDSIALVVTLCLKTGNFAVFGCQVQVVLEPLQMLLSPCQNLGFIHSGSRMSSEWNVHKSYS